LEQLVGLAILVILLAGVFLLINRARSSPIAGRAGHLVRSRIDNLSEVTARQPTLDTLRSGDAISFSDGTDAVVESVLECREEVGPRVTSWRWSFLDDQKLLEAAPDGNVLYDRSEIAHQGGELFQRLVAEAGQGGVLKLFEQRVRAGTAASNPLTFEHAGLTFHMRSTGTFSAVASGNPLGEVWRDIGPQANDNVFFEAEAQSGEQLLGVWTSHIVLLVGRQLGITDIDSIFPGAEAAT